MKLIRALTNLVKVILEGKVPFELRPYFFDAKLIVLKEHHGWFRPITVGNTFRRLSAKCTRYHVFELFKQGMRSTSKCMYQKGRWIGITCVPWSDRKPQAQSKRYLQNWLWNRFQFDKPSIHARGNFRSTPWNLEVLTLGVQSTKFPFLRWSDFVKGPIKEILSLQFQYRFPLSVGLAVWCQKYTYGLDDGSLTGVYRTILKDLKKSLKRKQRWDTKQKPGKMFFGDISEKQRSTRPEITSRLIGKENYWNGKNNKIAEKLDACYGFFMVKNCFSLAKFLYSLRTSTF